MRPPLGPVEQMTQAPGEFRRIPISYDEEKVAVVKSAQRLLDECNGDMDRAIRALRAVADA